MTMTALEVLEAFDHIRRASQAGKYSPHKPLLILLALSRVQQGAARLVEFSDVDVPLKALLTEFGPGNAAKSRHNPFWHFHTDQGGALWEVMGPEPS